MPYTDPECTYRPYKADLVDKVKMSPENIFPINPELSGILTYVKLFSREI